MTESVTKAFGIVAVFLTLYYVALPEIHRGAENLRLWIIKKRMLYVPEADKKRDVVLENEVLTGQVEALTKQNAILIEENQQLKEAFKQRKNGPIVT